VKVFLACLTLSLKCFGAAFVTISIEGAACRRKLLNNGCSRHSLNMCIHHRVLTYIEYRAVSGVFRTIDPPPLLHPASVSSPRTKGGGTHSPGGEGGGRSIFSKTPDIGLTSCSIIPLRYTQYLNNYVCKHSALQCK